MQWKLVLLKAGPITGNATTLSCLTPQKRQTKLFFSGKKDGKKSGLFTLFLTDDVGSILVEEILIYIQILSIYYNMSTVNNKTMIITLVFLLLSSYHPSSCIFSFFQPSAIWVSRIVAPFSAINLVSCGSAIWMSWETFSQSMVLIGRIILCRSQKIVPTIFICFVRKRLIIDGNLKAIALLFFFENENERKTDMKMSVSCPKLFWMTAIFWAVSHNKTSTMI